MISMVKRDLRNSREEEEEEALEVSLTSLEEVEGRDHRRDHHSTSKYR